MREHAMPEGLVPVWWVMQDLIEPLRLCEGSGTPYWLVLLREAARLAPAGHGVGSRPSSRAWVTASDRLLTPSLR
jgi:hypothetical protein